MTRSVKSRSAVSPTDILLEKPIPRAAADALASEFGDRAGHKPRRQRPDGEVLSRVDIPDPGAPARAGDVDRVRIDGKDRWVSLGRNQVVEDGLDLDSGRIDSLLVAHGRSSDRSHSGWLQRFSNEPGSFASSAGAYMTSEAYDGNNGASRRLIGPDPRNSNAESRAIVIHPAWYVSGEMARTHGKIGRSEGCFAFAEGDIAMVLERLGPGRMIYADKV
ncbi:MAG: murein L,D-transpeptidase catalytic domain-containing protein [Parasphingopyxis sp.]